MPGVQADALFGLLHVLKLRGVPLHGVALQMHLDLKHPLDPRVLNSQLQRLASLDLEIHIMGLDVRIENPVNRAKLFRQARSYRDLIDTCLAVKGCTSISLSGFTDRESRVPYLYENTNAAQVIDARRSAGVWCCA